MASSFTRRHTLVAASALVLVPGTAFAANRFSVISVTNETRANLTIAWRWASDNWQQTFLGPNARHVWWYEYKQVDQNRSPDFHLRFDADSRSGSQYTEPKKLRGYAAPEANFDLGHKYAFRYDGPSKRYIEIYELV